MSARTHDELYSSAVALLAQVETRSKNGGNVDLLAGAALDLCLEIARNKGDWAVVVTPDGDPECGVWWSAHFDVGPIPVRKHLEYADTPAEALARLALAALKGGDND